MKNRYWEIVLVKLELPLATYTLLIREKLNIVKCPMGRLQQFPCQSARHSILMAAVASMTKQINRHNDIPVIPIEQVVLRS